MLLGHRQCHGFSPEFQPRPAGPVERVAPTGDSPGFCLHSGLKQRPGPWRKEKKYKVLVTHQHLNDTLLLRNKVMGKVGIWRK